MKASDIAQLFLGMKGRMPESSRALLANRFVQMLGRNLARDNPKQLQQWLDEKGPEYFYRQCQLVSGQPHVHPEMNVHDTDLATFCNRWMNVEKYRDPEDGEWKPISPEMNQIRYTIVRELEELWKAQRRMEGGEDPD